MAKKTKKKNERNAGRKRLGEGLRLSKSVSIDEELCEYLVKEFGSLSKAVNTLGNQHKLETSGPSYCRVRLSSL